MERRLRNRKPVGGNAGLVKKICEAGTVSLLNAAVVQADVAIGIMSCGSSSNLSVR
jgi:hypothetical protein